MQPRAVTLTAIATLALAGCGSSASHSSTSTAPPAASSGSTHPSQSRTASGCTVVDPLTPRAAPHLRPPRLRLDPNRTYTVTVATNCGTFAFTLDVKDSPKTAASFYSLVKAGFFNGVQFHRVVAGFVIQGGDPTGTGSGGPGYTIVEPPPQNIQYVRGDVAMAKTQTQPRGASGSQFFVVTAANATRSAGLAPDYALLGKVVSGQNVVDRIGALPTNPPGDGSPNPGVEMGPVTVSVR